jgi:hypothetical protein
MPTAAPMTLQGVFVDQAVIDPQAFFQGTRRRRLPLAEATNRTWSGLGGSESVTLQRAGIISELHVRVTGTIVVPASTAPTFRWPYDLLKRVELNANGQARLLSMSGAKLKAFTMFRNNVSSDRGVVQTFAGVARTQGTLAQNSDAWGFGPGTSPAAATYQFDLTYEIPIAFNTESLVGAIFAQTSSTAFELKLEWATMSDLFSVQGAFVAPTSINANYSVTATSYSVPYAAGEGGQNVAVLPDLTMFHQLAEVPHTQLAAGNNEIRLAGQGPGRQLMRILGQTWSNQTTYGVGLPTPLAITDANYQGIGYRYGTNDTPEYYAGSIIRRINEYDYNCDLGSLHGFYVLDFATKFALRDSIDEGMASELRIAQDHPTSLVLTNPRLEYVQEILFSAIGSPNV